MDFVDVILTTDKRFYIAPPWTVKPGDKVAVDNQCEEEVLKTVDESLTLETDGDVVRFLKKFTGCDLKRINAKFSRTDMDWD